MKFIVQNSKFKLTVKGLKLLMILSLCTFNFALLTPVVYAQQATLALSPSSGTFNKGCNFSLDIILNTGGAQTDGTDAVLKYDPTRVTALSITNGTIYPEYPGNSIRDDLQKIQVSGLASVSTPFTGTGTLATINFKVKDDAPTGAMQVNFLFDSTDKGNTSDSNVVERGAGGDILNSVTNGSYIIGSGACTGGTNGSGTGVGRGAVGVGSTAPSTGEDLQKKLPPAGTEQLTATIAIIGTVLVILGAVGLAIL